MALRNRGYGYILIYLYLADDARKLSRNSLSLSTTNGSHRETHEAFRRRTEVTVPILHDFHPLPFRMMKVYSSAAPYSQTKMSKRTAAAFLPHVSRPLSQHLLLKNIQSVFFFQ